jgi:agmatine/peptidylarginine deiminase
MSERGRLPLSDDLSMPARFSPHERSYVAWPASDDTWIRDNGPIFVTDGAGGGGVGCITQQQPVGAPLR